MEGTTAQPTITLDLVLLQSIHDELARLYERVPCREGRRALRLITQALTASGSVPPAECK